MGLNIHLKLNVLKTKFYFIIQLTHAIDIISCLADALERDSKETKLFPNNICIKLEHHAARVGDCLPRQKML